MIAKLERTQKTAQQNMEQPQTPPPTHTHTHNGNNNKQLSHFVGGGSLSTFNWYQVFAQDYKVLLFKHKNCLNSGFLVTIAMYYH